MRRTSFSPLLLPLAALVALLPACAGSRPAAPALPPANAVATYGGETLTLADFESRYARAVGSRDAAADSSVAAYTDFLNRYVDFRLKVMAARQAGLEADSALQAESAQYRLNLARPYMLEREVIEPVVRELYEKQRTIVDASHILVMAPPEAAPADTLAAYNKLQAAVDSVAAGMPFEEAAVRFSEDPSARGNGPGAGGNLGFFTAGDMVDEFENMAYTVPVGQLSPIFRTRFGYHVLKVNARKPAPRALRVGHIMIRPNGSEPAQLDSARAEAQALRDSLLAGADFAALATAHSDDPGSAERGGELGVLTWRTNVVEPFKSTALALENTGDISEVVETSFGFHVIKVLEKMPEQTFDEAFGELKGTVSRLPRAKAAQDALAEKALAEYGMKADTVTFVRAMQSEPYDSLAARYRTGRLDTALVQLSVARIGDEPYSLGDVLRFWTTQRPPAAGPAPQQAGSLLHGFLLEKAIDYEAAHLDAKDAEFARIMDEFKDGLLLFRVMEDSVWKAAQQDSAGLRAYYDAHRDAYQFPERTRVVSITAPSDSLLEAARARIEGGLTFEALAAEMAQNGDVRIDTILIAGATNTVYDRALPLAPGQFVGPLPHRGTSRILLYHGGMDAARPKTFEEAQAEVTTAYQEMMDAALRARLRARYDARLYPEKLQEAFSGPATAPATTPAGR